MKRLIGLLMVVMLVAGTFCTSFADTPRSLGTGELSYDQYINMLAKSKGISREAAIMYDNAENAKYEQQLEKRMKENPRLIQSSSLFKAAAVTSGYYTYSTATTTKAYPNRSDFKATASITVKIYVNGTFREIVSKQGSVNSYITSGSNAAATWVQTNAWDDPSGGRYPTTSVTYGAEGRFEIVTQQALTGTAGVGLTLSGTIGQNYYYRTAIMSVQGTKGVY